MSLMLHARSRQLPFASHPSSAKLAIELAKYGISYPTYIDFHRVTQDVTQIGEDFACPVCLDIPRLPHIICKPLCLTFSFCLPCVMRILQTQVVPTCPLTRSPFLSTDVVLDRRQLKLLDQVVVTCEWSKSHGCKWIGTVAEWDTHVWESLADCASTTATACPGIKDYIQGGHHECLSIPSYRFQPEPLRIVLLRTVLSSPPTALPKALAIELLSHYLDVPAGDVVYGIKEKVLDWLGFPIIG
jgi:hypothetical protein